MAKKIIINDQEFINKLEALGFETNSRRDLLSHLIQSGARPTDPAFQDYHKEYQEFFVQYETAKSEFERQFVRPLCDDGRQLTWSLDYASRELTIQGID